MTAAGGRERGADRPWWAIVAFGVVFASASEAYALFAGEYVPYIDWSNHLGLISIFAHGDESGALAYTERSLAPRPYLLFYLVAGGLSFVTTVPAAAKLAFVWSAGLSVVAMAFLLRALDRPVVAAMLAPLALYGFARGYGFSSFVFTVPLVLLVLATYEGLLARVRTDAPSVVGAAAGFSGAFLLCYLGHALWVLPAGVVVGLRGIAFAIGQAGRPARVGRAAGATLAAVAPALLCAAIAWNDLGPERPDVTLHRADAEMFLWGQSLTTRWPALGGHLLERGSPSHWTTMYGVAALFSVLTLLHVATAAQTAIAERRLAFRDVDAGALVYAVFFALLYAVGPESVGWPQSVWLVYPRYATMGALALFLWPKPRLGGGAQVGLAACALALVAHNAALNRGHVASFSAWASRYDPVRRAVPPKSTVLALTGFDPGDWVASQHALGSLYFYHLCDGAAYTAFLFDNPMHPVRLRADRPPAPPWNNTSAYSPSVHGVAYDYLVLRGKKFVAPTEAAGLHEVVLRHAGWVVFRTRRDSLER